MAKWNIKEQNKKYYTIPGTSLRYSQMTAWKIKKGTMSIENLARNIAKSNPFALKGLFSNAEKEFVRLSRNPGVTSPEKLMQAITTAYRSALYLTDKGRLLAENLKEIIPQVMTEDEITAMKAAFNQEYLNFDDWTWNKDKKRLESPDGKHWVKVVKGSKSNGYIGMTIEYE